MQTRYIFITGGVTSGLSKGITAAALGRLLKERGFSVTIQKLDPYLNVDAGTMDPSQHGEIYVTEDGHETDLELGHYERFIDETLSHKANVTSGKIYWSVINKEREGVYQGATVQLVPHITNEIKEHILKANEGADFAIVEVGGTIGDIEGLPFLEAIRQLSTDLGKDSCVFIHVVLLPYIRASKEQKTKPAQHSVKELLSLGIQPDFIACKSKEKLLQESREKIALYCNLPVDHVIETPDVENLYQIPLMLHEEKLDTRILELLQIEQKPVDLSHWATLAAQMETGKTCIKIGIIGKYIQLPHAHASVVEALKHAAGSQGLTVEIEWIDATKLANQSKSAIAALNEIDAFVLPGGFGESGTEGMMLAAQFAREHKVPFLGISLGMQLAVIEFAQNVLHLQDANSTELCKNTPHPVVTKLDKTCNDTNRDMRLGNKSIHLAKESQSYHYYKTEQISERHRHQYAFNPAYQKDFQNNGFVVAATSQENDIIEIMEFTKHPFYMGVQFHPEYKSRPNRPHPLFQGLVQAAKEYKEAKVS